ncbi:MAG: hypothetical protein PHX34_05995 [Candidatus Shapirobacteria bacterium]|nr:hypothetical protein [Candidatus Shapirobacteria bacterium]
MTLKLSCFKNRIVDENYPKIMGELNSFFGINWTKNQPKIIIVENRKAFNELLGEKTEKWLVGYANNQLVYILNGKKFKTEADREYSDEKYKALIKHELAHLFFNIVSPNSKPTWLKEGVPIYLSGQDKLRKKIPSSFKNFLKFFDKNVIGKESVYDESGLVIKILIKDFGKEKLLQLIKSKDDFKKSFKKIYGFDLNYVNLNKIYSAKK